VGKGTKKYYTFLIYLIVVILLNVAGMTLFFRMDLTSNSVYSLSEASKAVVKDLPEPLTVKVFFSRNLPAPYNNMERYLRDLLEEYLISGKRRFNYQFHNVSAENDSVSARNQELARTYGIQPVQIQNIEQDEVKFQQAYMGMALLHGDVVQSIPAITSTEGLEYLITSTIRKMSNKMSALLRLKEPVSVKLYLSSSLSTVGPYMNITGLAQLPDQIEEEINRLNRKHYGKLAFIHIDPDANPEAEREAEERMVLRLNWQDFRDRRGQSIPAGRGYAGIIVEHGGRAEMIRLIEVIRLPLFGTQYQLIDLNDLEQAIDKSVEALIGVNEEIGYIADHGTPSLRPSLSFAGGDQGSSLTSLNTLLSETYSVRPVNLKEGGIPDGLSFLMIAGPRENFSEYELYQIDQFLMKGKSLAIFLDSFNEVVLPGQQGMMGQAQRSYHVPLNTGLEKLLSHYGLEVHHSIVLDENSYRQRVPLAFGGGERRIYFAPIIKNEMINREAVYLNNIKGLVMLKASPVAVDDEVIRSNNLKATRLFSSSPRSWEMKEKIEMNAMFLRPPEKEEDFRSVPLAYAVEGEFPSFFSDRPVPVIERDQEADQDGEGEGSSEEAGLDMSEITPGETTIKQGEPGKIFLIGTSEILKDNVIDREGQNPNAQFIMNVIDYLSGREETAVLRSKVQKFNPLREVSPAVRTTVKSASIAGLPALVVFTGLIVWTRRAARKRLIQKIFSR
jgi:ABC-type uncharacterized transport system involved in gliding motility auxiliary subunit